MDKPLGNHGRSKTHVHNANSSSVQRKASRSSPISNSHGSTLDTLLHTVPKNRAEKAIAYTGDISVAAALDWIMTHEEDPSLDRTGDREYLVYLCPFGPLGDQIEEFLRVSASQCGRNGAHLHLPHITMCHAFKSHHSQVPAILQTIKEVYNRVESRFPEKISVERYASQAYIGLFLDDATEKPLREFSERLLKELQAFAEAPIPKNDRKAYHMTLAHRFDPRHYDTLQALSKNIHLKTKCEWQFRLYSRDPKFNSFEVYQKVSYPSGDSISKSVHDDFFYVNGQEIQPDQPLPCISWSSGLEFKLPPKNLRKCFDSDVWILHGVLSYADGILSTGLQIPAQIFPPAQRQRWVLSDRRHSSASVTERREKTERKEYPAGHPSLDSVPKVPTPPITRKAKSAIYVMRHGERMDFVFGWNWVEKCFDAEGNFIRSNLNMPKSVPRRRPGPEAYIRDPPLTAMGVIQAQMTGRAMYEAGVLFSRIFVSPALRSIQTACAVLEGCPEKERKCTKICIEPAMYEWLGWVKEAPPEWLAAAELISFGLPVDPHYTPSVAVSQLNFHETVEEVYTRNGNFIKKAVQTFGREGGNMLFVGHACSLDTCTRELCGNPPRSHFDMNKVCQRVPYCAVASAVEGKDKRWSVKNPPFPPLTHGANPDFNAEKTFLP